MTQEIYTPQPGEDTATPDLAGDAAYLRAIAETKPHLAYTLNREADRLERLAREMNDDPPTS